MISFNYNVVNLLELESYLFDLLDLLLLLLFLLGYTLPFTTNLNV